MAEAKAATTKEKLLVKASARSLHISPRKMRLITNAVKNLYVDQALAQLQHMNKKGAPMVVKLLNSAVANASHNFSIKNPDWLFIKTITTDMGQSMKRYFPRARGSAFTIRRKMCHVNLVLEEKKRKEAAAGRFTFLKKQRTEKTVENVDQQAATNEKTRSEEPKKRELFKTDEQRKSSTVAQKRRLFTRKTGE